MEGEGIIEMSTNSTGDRICPDCGQYIVGGGYHVCPNKKSNRLEYAHNNYPSQLDMIISLLRDILKELKRK